RRIPGATRTKGEPRRGDLPRSLLAPASGLLRLARKGPIGALARLRLFALPQTSPNELRQLGAQSTNPLPSLRRRGDDGRMRRRPLGQERGRLSKHAPKINLCELV